MESAEREIQTLGEGGLLAYTKGPSALHNISVVGIISGTQIYKSLASFMLWHNLHFGIIYALV